jgi:hypothetical protein
MSPMNCNNKSTLKSFSQSLGIAIAIVAFLEIPAHAYLDAGTGSMVIQMLLGGVAGVAVMARLGWRRLRDRFGSNRKDKNQTPNA